MTKDEIKDGMVNYMKYMVKYWNSIPIRSTKDKLDGLVFSILVMFDGEADFDRMDIIAEGVTINDGDLHELWSKYK